MIIDLLFTRVTALKLHGLIAHWDEIEHKEILEKIVTWEESERAQRSLDRRLASASLERFKPLSEFDWNWPTKCDRGTIEKLMHLDFLNDATNIILSGPNGIGKSTIASNITYQTVMQGHTAIFVTASQLLSDLTAQETDRALRQKLKKYAQPALLVIDEVGYLPFSTRAADMLFQLISARYEKKSTIITTNKAFNEWGEVFPSAACVVSLIDRLIHHSEIIGIEGESFRLKEAKEKAQRRKEKVLKK
jgi:DNA replication protein DnaC